MPRDVIGIFMHSPASQEDQILARAIATSDPSHLAPLHGVLPAEFLNSLHGLLQAANAPYAPLAATFATMGLKQTALACLDRALSNGPPLNARADILEHRYRLLGDPQQGTWVLSRLRGQGRTPALDEDGTDDLRTVSATTSAGEHARLRDAVPDHPLRRDPLRDPWHSKPDRLSRHDPVMGAAEDASFLVVQGNAPVLHVECTIEGDGPLACLQSALRLTPLPGIGEPALILALDRLEKLATHLQAPFILVERDGDEMAPVADWLDRHGRTRRSFEQAWIMLDQSPQEIEKAFRDTHRQQVRWGRRNLDIRRWQGDDDDSLVGAYFELCRAENRAAPMRPDDLRQRLADDAAWLYVAHLDANPVSVVIVSRHDRDCYYQAGISRRLGNKPLSHAPLAQAILDAHDRGLERFHLGLLHTDPAFDAKLRGIAGFKRGFTRSLRPLQWVAVHPAP